MLFGCLALPAAVTPLSAASICDSVSGNLVANCGFETGDFTGWTAGGNFESTQVSTGTFFAYSGANSSSWYATLGPFGSDASLSQTLSTTNGAAYALSFYFASAGDAPGDFSALWNGTPLLSLHDPNTGVGFTQFSRSVTGSGSDTIQFNFRDDPAYMALDDVVVEDPGTVPEPGTIATLLAGLGALAVRRHRRA